MPHGEENVGYRGPPQWTYHDFHPTQDTTVPALKKQQKEQWISDATRVQQINFASNGAGSNATEPMTITQLLRSAANRNPNLNIYAQEPQGRHPDVTTPLKDWESTTISEVLKDSTTFAQGLVSLGVSNFGSIGIWGNNSKNWMLAALGTLHTGSKIVGIFGEDTPEEVTGKINHSGAQILFVDNMIKLAKISGQADKLEKLRWVIVWGSEDKQFPIQRSSGSSINVMTLKGLIDASVQTDPSVLQHSILGQKPGQAAALLYPKSDTKTKHPILLSHDNLIFQCNSFIEGNPNLMQYQQDRTLGYISNSHISGLIQNLVAPLVLSLKKPTGYGTTVYFTRQNDLRSGKIIQRMKEIEPTILFGFQSVFEQIMKKYMENDVMIHGWYKWAESLSVSNQIELQNGGRGGPFHFLTIVAEMTSLHWARTELGLTHITECFCPTGNLSQDVLDFFRALGVHIRQLYGVTECAGVTIYNNNALGLDGSIGLELPSTEVRLFQYDQFGEKLECPSARDLHHPKIWEQGEICIRGRHVMMGYYASKNEDARKVNELNTATIDEDGWLHTGDLGVRKNGLFRIMGRVEDIYQDENSSNPLFIHPTEAQKSVAHARKLAGLEKQFNTKQQQKRIEEKENNKMLIPSQKQEKKIVKIDENENEEDTFEVTQGPVAIKRSNSAFEVTQGPVAAKRSNSLSFGVQKSNSIFSLGQATQKIYQDERLVTSFAHQKSLEKKIAARPSIPIIEEESSIESKMRGMNRQYIPLNGNATISSQENKRSGSIKQDNKPFEYEFKAPNDQEQNVYASGIVKDKWDGPAILGDDFKSRADSPMGAPSSKFPMTVTQDPKAVPINFERDPSTNTILNSNTLNDYNPKTNPKTMNTLMTMGSVGDHEEENLIVHQPLMTDDLENRKRIIAAQKSQAFRDENPILGRKESEGAFVLGKEESEESLFVLG